MNKIDATAQTAWLNSKKHPATHKVNGNAWFTALVGQGNANDWTSIKYDSQSEYQVWARIE